MTRQAATERGPGARPRVRLDKWLWTARFLRSREACAALVRNGRVRVGGRRVAQPGTGISIGDILTLALPGRTIVVEILATTERRGDSASAAILYRALDAGQG